MKALRLPARAFPVTYLVRFRAPHVSPKVRARLYSAPVSVEDRHGPGHMFSRLPKFRRALVWTWAGSLRFPGDPSCAFAPLQDPGRTDDPSPLADSSVLPPLEW